MNVLLYNDLGVGSNSAAETKKALRSLLADSYDIVDVDADTLTRAPWPEKTSLLVIPGGRDLPYVQALSKSFNGVTAQDRISSYVSSGGRYLGICAGAYFACRRIVFEPGTPLEVIGDRPLGFFPGTCRGATFPGFKYDSEEGARETQVSLNRGAWRDVWPTAPDSIKVHWNGGGSFEGDSPDDKAVRVLASYQEIENNPSAGVFCRFGKGCVALWSVHPEHFSSSYSTSTGSNGGSPDQTSEALLRATLDLLGLQTTNKEAPMLPLMPLLLVGDNKHARVASDRLRMASSRLDDGSLVIKDPRDTFELHSQQELEQITSRCKSTPPTIDPADLEAAVKHIILCETDRPNTPLFDFQAFDEELIAKRSAAGDRSRPDDFVRFGSLLLYGEAVTSTQTLLDRNPKFANSLQNNTVFMASHQIAGRGRGSNSWISSPGCLQFSILLRLPMSFASKIVFVQYLMALAIVDAIKGRNQDDPSNFKDLIKIKWPNDIYVEFPDDGRPAHQRRRKIGGILVNSTCMDGKFTLVVGCGINTTNTRPGASLNESVETYNNAFHTTLPPFTQEALFASIMVQFEEYWLTFLEAASFDPFLDRYINRWMHSGEVVTIQSTGRRVRIIGITSDFGLLRTSPAEKPGSSEFIDLQPDGNGFDMLQGLIVVKN